MREQVLPPLAYATDDHVGIWYEGLERRQWWADMVVAQHEGLAPTR